MATSVSQIPAIVQGEVSHQLGGIKRKHQELEERVSQLSQQISVQREASRQRDVLVSSGLSDLSQKLDRKSLSLSGDIADINRKVDTIHSGNNQNFDDICGRFNQLEQRADQRAEFMTASARDIADISQKTLLSSQAKIGELDRKIDSVHQDLSAKIEASNSSILSAIQKIFERLPPDGTQ